MFGIDGSSGLRFYGLINQEQHYISYNTQANSRMLCSRNFYNFWQKGRQSNKTPRMIYIYNRYMNTIYVVISILLIDHILNLIVYMCNVWIQKHVASLVCILFHLFVQHWNIFLEFTFCLSYYVFFSQIASRVIYWSNIVFFMFARFNRERRIVKLCYLLLSLRQCSEGIDHYLQS